MSPRLLHERLGELGFSYSILYATSGMGSAGVPDDELRIGLCRGFNDFFTSAYRPFRDRLTVAGIIPRTSPPGSLQGEPGRSFEILTIDGAVVARASVPVMIPPSISTTMPGSPPNSSARSTAQHLASCLRAHGVAVPDPNPSAVPTQTTSSTGGSTIAAFPQALAEQAWQACRSILGAQSRDMSAYLDCMAAQGWFPSVMASRAPADLASYNNAAARCKATLPSTRDIVACLRSQGLNVVDPASAPNFKPPPQQFEPALGAAAWNACRSIALAAQALPADMAAHVLAFPDCMAAKGWITYLMTAAPTGQYDEASYTAARSDCS